MSNTARARHGRPVHHWRRDLVALAALFTAAAVADGVADPTGHGPGGPALLVIAAFASISTAAFHTWRARRRSHASPGGDPVTRPPAAPAAPGEAPADSAPRRMRTTVRDTPGSPTALCTAPAARHADTLSPQTRPPVGGTGMWTERADAHALVDAPTRILGPATRTALDAAELPSALRQLSGWCTIRSLPVRPVGGGRGPEEVPDGGTITVERPCPPFTPTGFARAQALEEPAARLGPHTPRIPRIPRIPRGQDALTPPEDDAITVRRAGTGDLAAARAMHERCSPRTLALRYHGPVGDADRYLDHLLSPRFGRTLAARTASGRIIGLGHLLWDGDETEVALLVEDAWQRRGIGAELLDRLVAMAVEAGCASVYAVTQSSNTAMVAALRGLGLPLDFQVEEDTLVVTARLDATPVVSCLPYAARREEYEGPRPRD